MRARTFGIVAFLLITLPVCGAPVAWAGQPTVTPPVEDAGTFSVALTPQMLTVIPMLALLLQILKGLEPLQKLKPWFPILAIGVAIAAAILMKMGADVQSQVVAGLMMGLATTGGYEASRIAGKVAPAETAALPPAGGPMP